MFPTIQLAAYARNNTLYSVPKLYGVWICEFAALENLAQLTEYFLYGPLQFV